MLCAILSLFLDMALFVAEGPKSMAGEEHRVHNYLIPDFGFDFVHWCAGYI